MPARKQEDPKKKDVKSQEQKEMAMLFRPVQKVEKGILNKYLHIKISVKLKGVIVILFVFVWS